MPYTCKLEGSKWNLTKKGSEKSFGSHGSKAECMRQMRAIYANEARSVKNMIFEGTIYTPWNLDELITASDDPIRVAINSRGGDFVAAISIHNKLRNSGKKVITYIDPVAVSAGAVIAMAGDEIYMPENGLIMFHSPAAEIQNSIKDADELEKITNGLRAMESVLIKTLASRTNKSEDECRKIMKDETYFTAEEALRNGIVDEIIPISRDYGKDFNVLNFHSFGFPERIVNYLQEKQNMPLNEVCQQFGVKDESELVSLITNLQKNQPKPPTEVRPTIVNMIKDARTVQLEQLVKDGVQTPDVVNELKTHFLNEDRIKLDCQGEDENKEFNRVITALSKNAKIVNFGGKTDSQQPPKEGADEGRNVLVERLEKQKTAAAKR